MSVEQLSEEIEKYLVKEKKLSEKISKIREKYGENYLRNDDAKEEIYDVRCQIKLVQHGKYKYVKQLKRLEKNNTK